MNIVYILYAPKILNINTVYRIISRQLFMASQNLSAYEDHTVRAFVLLRIGHAFSDYYDTDTVIGTTIAKSQCFLE